jgi:hypothetical protein
MKTWLRKFIGVNRFLCKKFETMFPVIFETASYRELILNKISKSIDRMTKS